MDYCYRRWCSYVDYFYTNFYIFGSRLYLETANKLEVYKHNTWEIADKEKEFEFEIIEQPQQTLSTLSRIRR